MASLTPAPKAQFFDANGNPLVGGKLYSYAAGTTTPLATYVDQTQTATNTNPIILDSRGEASVWLAVASYKLRLTDANNVEIWTVDNIVTDDVAVLSDLALPGGATLVGYSPGPDSLLGVVPLTVAAALDNLSDEADGSSYVGFLQAGANAAPRTAQSKMRDVVSVLDFGADPTGGTDSTAEIQAAIDSLSSGQTLNIQGNFKLTAGLTITNKSRIRLTGKGRVFFDGAPSGAYMFLLVGTIDDLEIDHLTLVGDGNSGYSQGAIGCNSGQTISNTRLHDLNIYNINVGISHNANLGGSWTNGLCYNNYLENILGTVAGSGYGIQAARAYNLKIYGNTINNASRHSIYIGKGQNIACVIEGNVIINHRKDVADGSPRCAIDCSRVSGVIIANNTFRDCYDGQIYLGADTGENEDNSDILIVGNKFGTPKNTVPCVWLGEQLVPTTRFLYKIDILDNTFEQDCSITTATVIYILAGSQITVKNNRLRAYSVAAALPIFIEMGNTSYISSDSHINDITVTDNVATSDKGSTVGGSRLLYIVDQLCTGSSLYVAKNNMCPNWAAEYYFEATPTNLNSKLKFRTTVTHDFGSISANTGGYTQLNVNGVKPTSARTGNCQSWNISGGNNMVFTFYPRDDIPNYVILQVNNVTTSSYDPPSQSFILNIEDF